MSKITLEDIEIINSNLKDIRMIDEFSQNVRKNKEYGKYFNLDFFYSISEYRNYTLRLPFTDQEILDILESKKQEKIKELQSMSVKIE